MGVETGESVCELVNSIFFPSFVTVHQYRSDQKSKKHTSAMDAIRKKMQSLNSETDSLMATIAKFESATKESNAEIDKHECDIRDLGKKTQGYEVEFDETNDKLTKALAALEEKKRLSRTLKRMSLSFQ